jgi:hypothetical protein
MGFKSAMDKLLLAATGFGLIMVAAGLLRNRGTHEGIYYCPYCKTQYNMTDTEFAVHVTQERRGVR